MNTIPKLFAFLILVALAQGCSKIESVALDSQRLEAGKEFRFTIETPFAPKDLAKGLSYQSHQATGEELPYYIHFDPKTLTYSGEVPANLCYGNLEVTIYEEGCEEEKKNSFSLEIYHEELILNKSPTQIKDLQNEIGSEIELIFDREWFRNNEKDELNFKAQLVPNPETPNEEKPLPEWLNFYSDESELRLVGIVPYDYCSPIINVQILVNDICITETMEIPINITNEKPELRSTIKQYEFRVGQNIQISLPNDLFLDPEDSPLMSYSLFQLENDSDGDGFDFDGNDPGSGKNESEPTENDIPDWLTFDATKFTINGNIPYSFCKESLDLRIVANDGCLASSKDFGIAILNEAPKMRGSKSLDRLLHAGEVFKFGFDDDYFQDPDGRSIIYSSTQADDQDLPDWLHFNPKTTTFKGQVPVGECFGYDLILIASDVCRETILPFGLTIINSPPVLTAKIPDQYFIENNQFTFQIPLNTFADPENGDLDILLKWVKDGKEEFDLPNWIDFDCEKWIITGKSKKQTEIFLKLIAFDNCNEVSDTFKIKIIRTKEQRSRSSNSLTLWLVFFVGSAIGVFIIKKMQIFSF
ncbi:dystroglycan-related [Anaeramoeba flamelloides]|uniref:Dystroglycan-related n=1 Tax=Anaeramoeba flamelloides TaxID=1746091 RepID=A0ABQ8YP41_9EUKA|nr:dystroglycan-related [Anaeramoeba flamelloides]